MDPITAAKLWLLFKPVQRLRKWRNRRRIRKGKDPLPIPEDDMDALPKWLREFVSMIVRHGFGLVGGWLAAQGITVTDSMVQTATGVILGIVALAWSWQRKRSAREATL